MDLGRCIICGAPYTGVFELGPCENGHTINEEVAYANKQLEDAGKSDERLPDQDFNLGEAEDE